MPGGEVLQRMLVGAVLRLMLILFAGILLAAGVSMAGAALALALVEFMPLWAAVLMAALAMFLTAIVLAALALARGKGVKPKPGAHNGLSPEILRTLAGAMEKRPKTTLGLALLAGIALGIDPGLRRELIALLKDRPASV